MVAVELSRLLRRGLFVAAVAAAGWLLGVVFAGTASAQPLPPQDQQQTQDRQPGGGLLGGLLGGVTDTLAGLTDTVAGLTDTVMDTTTTLLTPAMPPMPGHPAAPVPLPAPSGGSSSGTSSGSSSGTATTARDETPAAVVEEAQPVVAPAPVAPPKPVVAVPVPEPVVRPFVAPVAPPAPVVQDTGGDTGSAADEHAGRGDSAPQPVKAPAAPAGSGATVSTAHDSSGGARGTHGVLTTQATLHPADAGFTTRSRALDAAGRAAGLPAASPD